VEFSKSKRLPREVCGSHVHISTYGTAEFPDGEARDLPKPVVLRSADATATEMLGSGDIWVNKINSLECGGDRDREDETWHSRV